VFFEGLPALSVCPAPHRTLTLSSTARTFKGLLALEVLCFPVAVVLRGIQLQVARQMLANTDVGTAPAACRQPRGPLGHTSGPLGSQKRPSAHLQLRLVASHEGRRLVLHLALGRSNLRLKFQHQAQHGSARTETRLGRDLLKETQVSLQLLDEDLLHVVLTAFAQRHRRSATWLLALFAPMQTAPTARPPLHRNGTVRLPRQKAAGTSSV
jgi:hypothetical protein